MKNVSANYKPLLLVFEYILSRPKNSLEKEQNELFGQSSISILFYMTLLLGVWSVG